jgi:DNA repair protein RadA/Sms
VKKVHSKFVCQVCSYESPRWLGKCPECEQWNSFLEEKVSKDSRSVTRGKFNLENHPIPITEITALSEKRLKTGIVEFDRVLGGGIVPGSVVLIGGAPGMGKSTLLLQVGHQLAKLGKKILYISGEESLNQIKMRADRLGMSASTLFLLTETDVDSIKTILNEEKPELAVVDSIQTVYNPELQSLPGNVSQVRLCGYELTSVAKELQIPLFFIGHMTKDGSIAGPRVLEHMVDGLILLEGDDQHIYRLLRAVKNRFGSTNEVGIFEMTDKGIKEVKNPSEYLISQKRNDASGTVVTVSLEGTRPLLVEVQALVTPTSYGVPQRTATGIDHKRLSILLAVLEKRAGIRFGSQDVFVNAAGGLRLTEPGVDLAVGMAIVSSFRDRPVPGKTAILGEVGLTGEVRGVSNLDKRVAEAERLGFDQFYLPKVGLKGLSKKTTIKIRSVETVNEIINVLFG